MELTCTVTLNAGDRYSIRASQSNENADNRGLTLSVYDGTNINIRED